MKKTNAFLAALLLAISGVLAVNVPASACLGPDGNPVEGTDDVAINCAPLDQQIEYEEFFGVAENTLDFGRVTELDRSYTKQIEIKNNTQNDVVLDATVEKNGDVSDDNSKMIDWVAFVGGVAHFSIASGQTRSYSVRVFVPADAKGGSQYANVILTDANGHKETVVAKIDIAGDDLKYSSEVSDAWIDPVRLDEGLNGRATVKNTGTAGFASTFQVKKKNFFGGGDWEVIKEESQEVFPGGQVNFTATDSLGFGVFSIEQRVTFVNSEGRMIESQLSRTVINLPWWSLAIAGGVLIFIIVLIIVIKHHRKKNKNKDSDKNRKAEKKMRKADIDRIEKAEEDAIVAEEEPEEKEESEEKDDSEEVPTLDGDDDEKDEIEAIAEQLENSKDEAEDDDAEYDEGEAIPIKVTIKKSSKKE
jgi:hypothetical protein